MRLLAFAAAHLAAFLAVMRIDPLAPQRIDGKCEHYEADTRDPRPFEREDLDGGGPERARQAVCPPPGCECDLPEPFHADRLVENHPSWSGTRLAPEVRH